MKHRTSQIVRAFLSVVLFLGVLAAPRPVLARGAGHGATATILIGQSWVGLWRDGRIIRQVTARGWQFNAARLASGGRIIEVAAFRESGPEDQRNVPNVFRYDSASLKLLERRRNAAAGNWAPLTAPLGTDDPGPSPEGAATWQAAATEGSGTLLQFHDAKGRPVGKSHHLGAQQWRAAIAPDGATAAAFSPGAGESRGTWQGEAWNLATGAAIATRGLAIDDGSQRENGAARRLACLLPGGSGAIFTYVGAPADRWSEFQPFGSKAGPAITLSTPYIMTCLKGR